MHERLDIDFISRGTTCRAWFYPARTDALRTDAGVPCVVMAHGLGGTRDAGLEPYAERFASAGGGAAGAAVDCSNCLANKNLPR